MSQPYVAPAPRYSARDLSLLMEITTAVECECPNQLSQIVSSLRAFEEYSRNCENESAEDAKIHAMLYRASAEARIRLEDALDELVAYEEITIPPE